MTTDVRSAAPTAETARLTLLDALRGFALIGVLLMNIVGLSGLGFMTAEQIAALPTAAVDRPAFAAMIAFAYGKFYSIFSLLFGIGFALQLDAAMRRGDERLSVFKRRLGVLLLIGLVHMYFWEGDILVLYALIGFVLLLFRRVSGPSLVRIAAGLLFVPVLLQLAITASGGAANPGAPLIRLGGQVTAASGFAPDALPYPVLKTAGWGEYLRYQLGGGFFRYGDLLTEGRFFKVLAMFMVGLWIGRVGLLRSGDAAVPLLRRVRRWGFIVGVPASLLHAGLFMEHPDVVSWVKVAEVVAYAVGIVPLAFAYTATFALLYRNVRWRARLDVLAPAGRMALTNYLSQTVIQIAIFYGIGLGLMGEFGAALLLLLTAAIFTAQVLFSRWWLARYRFGPMEWIWRQATYGRRLPLRLDGTTSSPTNGA